MVGVHGEQPLGTTAVAGTVVYTARYVVYGIRRSCQLYVVHGIIQVVGQQPSEARLLIGR